MVRRGRGALAERLIREGVGHRRADGLDRPPRERAGVGAPTSAVARAGPPEAEPFERRALRLFERRGATAQAAAVAATARAGAEPRGTDAATGLTPPRWNPRPGADDAARAGRRTADRRRPRRRLRRRRDPARRRDDGDVLGSRAGAHARAGQPPPERPDAQPPDPSASLDAPARPSADIDAADELLDDLDAAPPRKSPSAAGSTADASRPAVLRASERCASLRPN